MTKTTIYVGLCDKDTKEQEISTLNAYKVASNIFTSTTGGATIYEGVGVYTHDNGDVVQEATLICIVYGSETETILKAADQLKVALNQESVVIETTESNSMFY